MQDRRLVGRGIRVDDDDRVRSVDAAVVLVGAVRSDLLRRQTLPRVAAEQQVVARMLGAWLVDVDSLLELLERWTGGKVLDLPLCPQIGTHPERADDEDDRGDGRGNREKHAAGVRVTGAARCW